MHATPESDNGARAGWVHAAPGGWQIHDRDGRLVTTLPADDAHGRDVLLAARHAAAALGIPGAEHAAVTVGPLHDDRGRTIDTSPAGLASWSLLKSRVPGRTDVIVRSRCVGWLQRDDRGRDVACTIDGPVPGSASTNRVQAVTALLAALVAPAPCATSGPRPARPAGRALARRVSGRSVPSPRRSWPPPRSPTTCRACLMAPTACTSTTASTTPSSGVSIAPAAAGRPSLPTGASSCIALPPVPRQSTSCSPLPARSSATPPTRSFTTYETPNRTSVSRH
ncbi:hypothetical protein ETD86_06985 [Nonomuraea turkmeniaca]|uniref:Uncharacterized protein n=1 Tax=Nonomuraea turkmeniaca TaxID=103838 RepID=A0A5S4FSY2_9ACTN|nr:hypothetical protein [Nonomuraea turkmeniaca]TMR23732.1 hypothetical protein ETD86_06985 [Nonomuraea turkmeniaca]